MLKLAGITFALWIWSGASILPETWVQFSPVTGIGFQAPKGTSIKIDHHIDVTGGRVFVPSIKTGPLLFVQTVGANSAYDKDALHASKEVSVLRTERSVMLGHRSAILVTGEIYGAGRNSSQHSYFASVRARDPGYRDMVTFVFEGEAATPEARDEIQRILLSTVLAPFPSN